MTFPFEAVVGAEDAKLALLLATVDPRIGGVLLRGDKGSAKTTLARGLAALTDGPFVDLPLGATEERLVGSLDLAAALTGGSVQVQPGLLASAHGGVLYVDEVNLLADHLVDVLLDVAASGVNRIERDSVSHSHPARFVLIGSMNPEEGDLRPQLLDRFGLAVDVRASADPAQRSLAVSRRLAYDADPVGFAAAWPSVPPTAQSAPLTDAVLLAASELAVAAGVEGLRADLVLARAAAALAGLEGRTSVTDADLGRVAPMVLAHRARRHPLDPPGAPPPPPPPPGRGEQREQQQVVGPDSLASVVPLVAPRDEHQTATSGRRSPVGGVRGRVVGAIPPDGSVSDVAPVATVVAAAARWAETGAERRVEPEDLRQAKRETRTGNLLVLAVDASGSMGADARMAAVKGALLGLLVDAYQRRDRVALVTFGGAGAEVVLRPTASVEIARARLEHLPTGGVTPLADGIRTAIDLAVRSTTPVLRPLLVLVTDGRATEGPDPTAAAATVRAAKIPAVVVDVEPAGPGRLGLASELAAAMAARHLPLSDLRADRLEEALRTL